MRLERFAIEGLFGLFNHSIPLNLAERITIIHAPNGYGKTIILKMISGFFGGSLGIFRQYEFNSVTFHFDNNTHLVIEQDSGQKRLFIEAESDRRRSYRMTYFNRSEPLSWEPDQDRVSIRNLSPAGIQRYLPFMRRVGAREWHDTSVGDTISSAEVLERYSDHLPSIPKRPSPIPDWLDALRSSVHCRLIETQRLITIEEMEDDYGDTASSSSPAVKTYATELTASIRQLLATSATLSQSLDQTFPSRLLVRMRETVAPPTETALRESLAELEKQRARLSKAGLLETSDESSFISHHQFSEPTRRILAEYVEDTRKKLSIYDVMLAKLELFTEILNARYQFKSVSVTRGSGFEFQDIRGRRLDPEALSSGEQHELVLVFDLLFKTNQNTLILIDEPEISLHVGWQKRFLTDLRQIISLTEIDALLATHSPQLIGKNLDLTVQLQGPDGIPATE